MEDQSKFFNVIIDKTNQKLNSFQAQVIVLESQLQMAMEERDTYKNYLETLSGHGVSINELNNYSEIQAQLKAALDENMVLKNQVANSASSADSSNRFLRDQNETLLQEIRRLKAEMAAMSGK
jgi:flagellar biosynthesis chaperone FliJ